jgi:hypothetical protein
MQSEGNGREAKRVGVGMGLVETSAIAGVTVAFVLKKRASFVCGW